MYNLFITALKDQWKKSVYELERSRCISNNEYTDKDIAERYRAFSKDDIASLITFPCLFAYEDQVGRHARLGWLTKIRPSTHLVRMEYEIETELPSITAAKVKKLSYQLDIAEWELNRTHWGSEGRRPSRESDHCGCP